MDIFILVCQYDTQNTGVYGNVSVLSHRSNNISHAFTTSHKL